MLTPPRGRSFGASPAGKDESVHQILSTADWVGQVATLHPLFVGAPIISGVAALWIAARGRGRSG